MKYFKIAKNRYCIADSKESAIFYCKNFSNSSKFFWIREVSPKTKIWYTFHMEDADTYSLHKFMCYFVGRTFKIKLSTYPPYCLLQIHLEDLEILNSHPAPAIYTNNWRD